MERLREFLIYRKSSVKETWEDVIDDVIGNRNISDELDAALDQGKFEVCLQTNTGPRNIFFAEMIEILNILALCNYL
jgi:hypothetical protein